jgi:crotonobetainyl-CoA:carnitine CoA-transferase CaiB-like acyl-CoA transferase
MGAEVIKVERPGVGDETRGWGPPWLDAAGAGPRTAAYFAATNRGKRSVTIDVSRPEGQAIVRRLARRADVLLENYKVGALARYGLGHADLARENPRLVYCSISGFGADGPYAERPSYDSVAQALSGFLSVVVDPERPRFLGPALADAITGIYAAFGILGALLERATTGQGRHVEVSMFEAMAHFAVEPFAAYFALGETPKSSDRPRLAQAYILRTADDRLLAIHLSSLEKFWQGLMTAIEAAELGTDARFSERLARIQNYEALGQELDRRFRRRPLADWADRLSANDVPFAPINGIDAVVNDPQALHLGLVVPVEGAIEGGREAVRPALQYDGKRATSVSPAPLLNQHGDAIRAALARDGGWPSAAPATVRRATG